VPQPTDCQHVTYNLKYLPTRVIRHIRMTIKLVVFIFYNRHTNILLKPQLYGMLEVVKADAGPLKGCA